MCKIVTIQPPESDIKILMSFCLFNYPFYLGH